MLMQDCTCVILFFISDTEHRFHAAVRLTNAVTTAHVSADKKEKKAKQKPKLKYNETNIKKKKEKDPEAVAEELSPLLSGCAVKYEEEWVFYTVQ